ncbi:hypothetical protein CSUI_006467 [Cystoisospora suis]|uniref:Uncharacterized protein n=1 Tax=Cystoisospora suis TaxID=483139 RepID=A0A2C6K0D2_9APIC|nr:hypothetical protein CSUI_006467 [Cystoisospora suis]
MLHGMRSVESWAPGSVLSGTFGCAWAQHDPSASWRALGVAREERECGLIQHLGRFRECVSSLVRGVLSSPVWWSLACQLQWCALARHVWREVEPEPR